MISTFRRYLDTWVARGFFLLMVVAFVIWGVGDVVRLVGTDTWVAKVGGETIEVPEAQQAFQKQMGDLSRRLPPGTDVTAEMRREVASAAVQGLVGQAVITQEERRLGIVVPDEAVRQAVFAIPQFRGATGQFDRATFEAVLRNNGLTEPRFLEIVRGNLAEKQLLETVAAGAVPPGVLVDQIFAYQFEKRSADMVELPFNAVPAPPAPDEAVLRRWYDNHPDFYSSPEYRRIKAAVLSPETLAKDIPITDAELRTAYDARKAQYVKPERRSVQVIQVPDATKAQALAGEWRSGSAAGGAAGAGGASTGAAGGAAAGAGGANAGATGSGAAGAGATSAGAAGGGEDWAAMQTAAKDAGGSAIELDDVVESGLPTAELGHAVFSITPGTVSDPTQGLAGWQILKVTKVTPGDTQSFEQVKDALRQLVLDEKAADLIYDRANKVDNILASGSGLDELPSDLGLVGVAGTMDAQGNTLDGKPAPIPGGDALRQALIAAAFQAHKGDPPRLTEVPPKGSGVSSYYALTVEDVIPPAPKPFEQVKDAVLADWTHDAVRHTQETAAAKLLTAVQHGQKLADAAAVAGVAVTRTPLTGREQAAQGVPAELLRPLFDLKLGEPTMVETPDGFIVAVPAEIVAPDRKSDPAGYDQVRAFLGRSLGQDVNEIFAQTLRERAQPRINQQNLDSISGP
jgi:peptidyl-prolyl cis-trans isomerase D